MSVVMGPDKTFDISTSKVMLPKLESDRSNWSLYQERVLNALTSKKLRRHVTGTARKPEELTESSGNFFKRSSLAPLSDKELEAHEDEVDDWMQKQAQVLEVIYGTIDKSTFLQIKNEPTAADVWKMLVSIYANKGVMFETDLLTRLQTSRMVEGDDMHTHLSNLSTMRECLAETGTAVDDTHYAAYIRTSVSLIPAYQPMISTLTTNARNAGRKVTSTELRLHLIEESDNMKYQENINKSNQAMQAMLSAHSKPKGKGSSSKGKEKAKSGRHCNNYGKDGHTDDQCFSEGGGKAGEAPDWWVKKNSGKPKGKGKENPANSAARKAEGSDDENYAFLSISFDSPSDDDYPNVALVITSGHDHHAHTTSSLAGVIIDCGASSHFSPSRDKFLNYHEISPEPIRAADGRTFSAIGRGNLRVKLPMKDGEKSRSILLKKVYYAPQMAFTLISASCLDRAGCSLHIEGGECVIRGPKPEHRIIGRVPEIRGLYRADPSAVSPPPRLTASLASKGMSISELHHRLGHINHKDIGRQFASG
ncbi:hypothetical protein D9615_008263 [Tricholomella constricta]|uniref:Retrovirus-related Pol polyprotein from transposon TNT 1-94-like beta-barrel domain-containing protein n=1 Tax=Tricholomella constricta TaxID=117010 RepID=A0A8H5H2T5_9AGAR|nr:hypothetical protein D9615_008263 [Tricholomella constricta]